MTNECFVVLESMDITNADRDQLVAAIRKTASSKIIVVRCRNVCFVSCVCPCWFSPFVSLISAKPVHGNSLSVLPFIILTADSWDGYPH
jgi:hypothetical protein